MMRVEIDRCLHRRLTWVLVSAAVLGVAIMTVVTLIQVNESNPINLVDLWNGDSGARRILTIPTVVEIFGGLVLGSSMVGAEWKAGTVATLLTWESRRVRVAVAKLAGPALVTMALALALDLVFVAGLLPVIFTKGSTTGADAPWWSGVVGATARGLAAVGLATALGAAIGLAARTTAAAAGVAFLYLNLIEGSLRGLVGSSRPWLIGENAAIFLTGHRLDNGALGHSVIVAGFTLLGYAAVFGALATWMFRRRDV